MKTKIFLFALLFAISITAGEFVYANNIQVSGGTLTGQVAGQYTYIQFNLSWENSWRDDINWDAAWVFVKYRTSFDTTWKGTSALGGSSDNVIPSGFKSEPQGGNTGEFVYRSSNGNGNVSLSNVKIKWFYPDDGISDNALVEVKVFAIEMVFIPQGNFFAGDGTTSNVSGQFSAGNTTGPFLVTNENAITLGGSSTSNLGNRDNANTTDDFSSLITKTLPAFFPKGFYAKYCMKYEISQGQYTEFLNTLTRHQQKSRVGSNISGDAVTNVYVMSNTSSISERNTITCPSSGNGTSGPVVFSCSRPDRACNYLSWMDGCAYLDWAGLMPMTELELEKISRGPNSYSRKIVIR